jgi:adenylosuccinate synthase
VARRGIQVIDLLHPEVLRNKLRLALEEKNILLQHHFETTTLELEPLFNDCLLLGERLRPFVADVRGILVEALNQHRPILFEGAQGTLLDVDHGTYPFVTSSNTVAAGALTGSGVGLNSVGKIIGITKAYTTRVGTGPFPTEMEAQEPETAAQIRQVGAEFGSTTGRPRRTGWLDLVALKYAVEVNGLNGLALMKADVLQNLPYVKVCTSYRLHGTTLYQFPSCIEDLEKVEPAYEIMPGWASFDPKQVTTLQDLPAELRNYMEFIQTFLGIPIVLMSTGPGREETLLLSHVFS